MEIVRMKSRANGISRKRKSPIQKSRKLDFPIQGIRD